MVCVGEGMPAMDHWVGLWGGRGEGGREGGREEEREGQICTWCVYVHICSCNCSLNCVQIPL